MRPIESTRWWRSTRPPEQVWSALCDIAAYRSWWPWLERLDGTRFEVGERLSATVRAPLGYRVRYDVHFTLVEPHHRVAAALHGDLGGRAHIELEPDGDGTLVRFRSSLHPVRTMLRMAGAVVEPVLVHGHDSILDHGVSQFVDGTGVDLTAVHPPGARRAGRDPAPDCRRRRPVRTRGGGAVGCAVHDARGAHRR